ncbi:hypothetical protein ACFFNY_04715 [Paenibacillus hodogayensis]|uniref:Uncharacterized protein n=1 Tax=Paenibacillus hodogayensis TaxID=279208 RepID=A0ABV5VRG6_9BACL
MSDKESATVCPWCQTEIVWDEEIGPEDSCPHCFNELNDYRSLRVHLEGDELELTEDGDELTELNSYGLAIKKRLEQQEDSMECARCQEEMVLAGNVLVEDERFTPFIPNGPAPAFIKPPFRLHMFVCPSCFQVHHSLSDEDRMRLVSEWSRPHNEEG